MYKLPIEKGGYGSGRKKGTGTGQYKKGQTLKMNGPYGVTYKGKVLDIKGNKMKVHFPDYDMNDKPFWISKKELMEAMNNN